MMLRDSARIQEEDARYANRKREHGEPEVRPLHDEDDDDARNIARSFEYVAMGEWHELAEDMRLRFRHAGHILGSAICELDLLKNSEWKRIVFTGDLGRRDKPLLNDPETVERCDVVITESTYGNNVHPVAGDVKAELQRVICDAATRGGKVVIPAFSLGRMEIGV